jgi:Response regulators consisting of a CheY-like receiver domain and a winged-helix DNA-binding domain
MNAHILVVEDNPDNSKLVSWILEDEGYEVTCVESGERCLALLDKGSFDLILMDISLPGISGKEVTRRIRQIPRLQKLPILALTAHAIEAEQQSILHSGVDDLLTKPLNDDQLLKVIQRYVGVDSAQ